MEQHKEQMKVLSEMGKITIDKNDYDKALKTLGEGLKNLTKLHKNWSNMVEFFSKISSIIEANLSVNMPKIVKWAGNVMSGDLDSKKPFVMGMIRKTIDLV